MLNDRIISVKNKIIDLFGNKIVAIVLTGSYAKGDYTPKSDIDIWIIFDNLQIKDLKQVSDYLNLNQEISEVNLQCVTGKELINNPFRKRFNPVQIYIDGIILYGKLPPYIPYNSEIRNFALSIAAEVLLSSRHYITTNESEDSLAAGKLLKWVIKPLSWVFRYNVLLRCSIYPRNFEYLIKHTVDNEDRIIIEKYREIIDGTFKDSYIFLNELCHEKAINILTK